MPTDAFVSFAGGFGQASLCGTLAVAAAFIGTVTDRDTQKQLVGELFNWYKEAPFPQYQPAGLNLKTTVAESTLCETSVSKFMEEQGVKYGDPERKERCAGVTAEVVKYVIGVLNARV